MVIAAAVHEACKEVFRSRKLKRLLELVLACGNYMNRGQRGNALGFQPASLNKMLDTRSSASKQITLLHYVVETLEKKVRLKPFLLLPSRECLAWPCAVPLLGCDTAPSLPQKSCHGNDGLLLSGR